MTLVVTAILDELRARGAVAYRRGGDVRMRPARAITPELLERVKRHKAELLPLLPDAPPATHGRATAPAESCANPWIVSAGGNGNLRLVIAAPPPWPDDVFEAAALVEVIDRHHRAGADPLAHAAAERLEAKLEALRRNGFPAWLAS